LFSLMSQYVPMGPAAKEPPFDRAVTREEYEGVVRWMELSGLREGFLQDFDSARTEYIPDFHLQGL